MRYNGDMVTSLVQSAVWSVGVDKLDKKKDRVYIIHQVLAYGTWEQLVWLVKTYDRKTISEVFVSCPSKDYTPASFNFVTNVLFSLDNSALEEKDYVRTYPRILR